MMTHSSRGVSPVNQGINRLISVLLTSITDCLYTKTYLSSVGDVRVVVDEMVEDNQLPNNSLVITYPKMLHVVQDGDQLFLKMGMRNRDL